MCAHLCACVGRHDYDSVHSCVCACEYGDQTWAVISHTLSTVAGHQILGILSSLPPQCWDLKHALPR